MDSQNRIIIPKTFSLSQSNKNNATNQKDENENSVDLVALKMSFDILQKEKNTTIVLSKALDTDRSLKSLLSGGLNQKSVQSLLKMVAGDVFRPVQASGVGKENLFEKITAGTPATE